MANTVIAGLDIPFQDPLRHVLAGQVDKALRDSICLTALFPETKGVEVGQSFSHGIQSQQI